MSDQTFFIPVIPTTSLFLMEELVGDKLDPYIDQVYGKSATFSKLIETKMPYKWLKYNYRKAPFLDLFYNRKHNSEEPFRMGLAVELATSNDIPEIWIDKLILHFNDDRWRDRCYTFKNKAVTKGSSAAAFVYNFHKKRRITNWIKRIPRRHLELVDASGLDRFEWQSQTFISFLSQKTHALIFKKQVKQLTRDSFVDEDILEV